MTNLRDTVKAFPLRQLKRFSPPTVTALGKVCAKYESATANAEQFEERIARILASIRAGQSNSLHRQDLRFVAVAIGNSRLITLPDIRSIFAEIDRRNESSLRRSVLRALLACYRDDSLRPPIREFVARRVDLLRSNERRFCEQSGVLESDANLSHLTNEIVQSRDIYTLCLSKGISGSILATNFGVAVKLSAVRKAAEAADEEQLQKTLDWAFSGIRGTPVGEYYEVMLAPFESVLPEPGVQKLVISRAVEKFGDPRILSWPALGGANGEARRERCLVTIKRWLSIEYLDLFIKIIEETAGRKFAPRKSFWLNYFENDKISDVTLVLASDADAKARKARSETSNTNYMTWAKLGATLADQSVLLMRIGDLIIAEWSHSGALRFWRANSRNAPEFHLAEYLGHQLRKDSLQVRVGQTMRDSITHHEGGQWMRWASNAIEHHTGVSV
jgi:EH_Signature domain